MHKIYSKLKTHIIYKTYRTLKNLIKIQYPCYFSFKLYIHVVLME